MQLKIKLLKWSAGIPVAMLNQKTASKIGIHINDRISIKTLSKKPKEVFAIIDIISHVVKNNEIAVSSELGKILDLKNNQKVDINLAPIPKGLDLIKKKLNKKSLSQKEIDEIINEIVNNSLSESEVALFISAMYNSGMDFTETIYLINSILKSGKKLSFKNKFVVDKHSIGGIPGNRTTLIVVPICAAVGLIIPKTSSRAITSAAGTADVVETIAKVDFSIQELKKIVKKTNACLAWGGSLGIVPADSKIIKIEKMLKIDPEAQLLASIFSKKLAMGAKYLLIDIPYGKHAKVKKKRALELKKKFEKIAKHFNKKIKVVLTKGQGPIGNGVGPALELFDIIDILDPKKQGPKDLEKKSVYLSGILLEMTGKAKKGNGEKLANEILKSGKAFDKFKEIVKEQKGSLKKIPKAKYKKHIYAKTSGKIIDIDNKKINSLARAAGCPLDKASGLYFYCHTGDKVNKRNKLLTIHAESKLRLWQAARFYKKEKPITIR